VQESSEIIVELKRIIDDEILIRVKKGQASCSASNVAMHPYDFIRKNLPFYHGDVIETIEDSLINSAQVVGGTYRNYEHESVDINYLNDINKASSKDYDKPIYYKVGDFPLYLAWEGKNRVSIFQKHKMDIVCRERLTAYPSADSLMIHKARFRKGIYFLSCKDENFIHRQSNCEQIYFPDYVLPLLKQYGVKEGKPVLKPFSVKSKELVLGEFSQCLMSN
jgi:hypothetical protein